MNEDSFDESSQGKLPSYYKYFDAGSVEDQQRQDYLVDLVLSDPSDKTRCAKFKCFCFKNCGRTLFHDEDIYDESSQMEEPIADSDLSEIYPSADFERLFKQFQQSETFDERRDIWNQMFTEHHSTYIYHKFMHPEEVSESKFCHQTSSHDEVSLGDLCILLDKMKEHTQYMKDHTERFDAKFGTTFDEIW